MNCVFKSFRVDAFRRQSTVLAFEREIEHLSSLSHPNIIQFYGAIFRPPRFGPLLEYCENGDLHQYFRFLGDRIDLDTKIRILHGVALAMLYLHSQTVLHRDLKPGNVLVDRSGTAKLMDFGLSRLESAEGESKTKAIGTACYVAPEVIRGEPYSYPCDVFSFAMLMFTVMSGEWKPYVDSEFVDLKVAADSSFRPDLNSLPDTDPRVETLKSLIATCWDDDQNSRLTFEEINKTLAQCLPSGEEGFALALPAPSTKLIYLRLENEPDEAAEDFNLVSLTIENLTKIVTKKWPALASGSARITYWMEESHKGEGDEATLKELSTDSAIVNLEEDSIVVVRFERCD